MRLHLRPLAAAGGSCPAAGGPPGLALWHARLAWTCAGTPLDLRVLAEEPLALPAPEPSEPVPGAIARCVRACAGSGALLLLANPAAALGQARIALAEGIRLMSIADPADEACWDAMLALGQPCYGVRDDIHLEVLRPQAAGVIAALAFGAFQACDGLVPEAVEESPRHVAWRCGETVEAEVLGRAGFPLARTTGPSGRYDDRGNEGVVRVVLRAGGRTCWTQPRFVAPRKDACAS
jgi:hypothetical protein